jgi:hypothetical protein
VRRHLGPRDQPLQPLLQLPPPAAQEGGVRGGGGQPQRGQRRQETAQAAALITPRTGAGGGRGWGRGWGGWLVVGGRGDGAGGLLVAAQRAGAGSGVGGGRRRGCRRAAAQRVRLGPERREWRSAVGAVQSAWCRARGAVSVAQ